MAKADRSERVDPTWPATGADDHVVSELVADVQGSLSPFGDLQFPLAPDELGYEHPVTERNK